MISIRYGGLKQHRQQYVLQNDVGPDLSAGPYEGSTTEFQLRSFSPHTLT
ncbi:hypothetical protein Ae331Ps2_6172 [Pseudonocardia sp. Ae331_Ps2]|nr:hypothetical protein Ae331Ps2_6172 [Pseudonocardia sp. Ae331_Ps2]